jgi:putative hydroxymethylpyrimidine transporter CytX
MDCVKTPFGRWGAGFFALANIVQLLGWTAVMVAQGAQAAVELLPGVPFPALAVGIGVLVAAWIFIGLGGVSRINAVAMGLLFALTAFLCVRLFGGDAANDAVEIAEEASGGVFWTALELSVAMPLSWLPLVADYTKDAQRPVAASAASAAIYTVVSCWMYAIGLGVALAGLGDSFAASVRAAGVGIAGVLVVVFSTVTTTFLDAYSAGESARSLWSRLPAKGFGVAVCALGTLLAIFVGMDHYLDFLYMIASVFAPMAAVQVVDWLRGAQRPRTPISGAQRPRTPREIVINLVAWAVGLAVYHVALAKGCPIGATLPAMAVSAVIASFNRLTV